MIDPVIQSAPAPVPALPVDNSPSVPSIDSVKVKTCLRCQKSSPLADYPANDVTADGHDSICPRCLKWKATTIKAQCKKLKKLAGQPIEFQPIDDDSANTSDDGEKEAPRGVGDGERGNAERPGEVRDTEGVIYTPVCINASVSQSESDTAQKSGFSKNLGDRIGQLVYTEKLVVGGVSEDGGVSGDLAGRKKLADEHDEMFCSEWVASGGEGGKAYRKAYGASEGGKKLEKLSEGAIKRYDIACRIRYLRDEKAVEECGFDIAQGKGRWMEAVCKLAMEASTARDKLKALELISKAMGHDKMKASGGGGTVIRVVTGVRGEPGKNNNKEN